MLEDKGQNQENINQCEFELDVDEGKDEGKKELRDVPGFKESVDEKTDWKDIKFPEFEIEPT